MNRSRPAGAGGGEMAETLIAPVQAPRILPPRPSQFLRDWFARCPSDQFLELRAIHAATKRVTQDFFALDAIDDLVGRAFSLVDEYDCFFGVCPRTRPKGDAASVTHAPGFFCDLDWKRFSEGEAGALRALAEFPLRPSWIIATGGGYHVYWRLKTPIRADASFEARLKALARILDADPAATDRARVLRVPGTWHSKRDFQVRILSWPT